MKIVFFGTPDFAVESLDAICQSEHQVVAVVTVPDRQSGRGQKVVYSPIKQYALSNHLPLLQPEKLRDPQFIAQLSAFEADCFVVVAFRMLPEMVWAMPPKGTFNLHASLLPKYRGAAPINWAIIQGEQETGITTFLLDHNIDQGSILLQERTPILDTDNAGTLHDRLAQMGRKLVVDTLDRLASDQLTPRLQPEDTCPAPKIFKTDCQIDLRKEAHALVNFVRGLAPYPAATLNLINPKGEPIGFKIFEVEADTSSLPSHIGELICDHKKMLKIGVADGFINILCLQMSGKRRNNIEEFLRGNLLNGWKTELCEIN